MTKIAVAIPTVWVSSMWADAWSILIALVALSIVALGAAWKMHQIEAEEKA